MRILDTELLRSIDREQKPWLAVRFVRFDDGGIAVQDDPDDVDAKHTNLYYAYQARHPDATKKDAGSITLSPSRKLIEAEYWSQGLQIGTDETERRETGEILSALVALAGLNWIVEAKL